eukprot:366119-Chlamydomonas_euryale.AAC.49
MAVASSTDKPEANARSGPSCWRLHTPPRSFLYRQASGKSPQAHRPSCSRLHALPRSFQETRAHSCARVSSTHCLVPALAILLSSLCPFFPA